MMMKSIIAFVAFVASAQAFVPVIPSTKSSSTAQYALADRIFNLDLFAPKADQNNYGARAKKNIKVGKLTEKSYIPSGMTLAQYEKIRKEQQKKRDENYQRNVKKAGVFTDYTEWYTKRGTELNGAWKKSVTLGHTMAKTKYDWSGTSEAKVYDGVVNEKFVQDIFGKKRLVKTTGAAAKKATTPTAKPAAKKMSFY
jgi:hypothetical protein